MTRIMKTQSHVAFLLALILFTLFVACQSNTANPRVRFTEPADGATAASPVKVVMAAENFTVEPAGDVREGTGHLHIIVDTPCLSPGEVIPRDEQHLHFGDGSTEAEVELTPGTHRLCLQAADGAHTALAGDGMTHTITINVP